MSDAEERRHFELFAPDGKLDQQHRLVTDLIVYQLQRNTTHVEPAEMHKVIEVDFDFAPSRYEICLPQRIVLQFFRIAKAKKRRADHYVSSSKSGQ